MKKLWFFIGHVSILGALLFLTKLGAVLYLFCLWIKLRLPIRSNILFIMLFLALYGFSTIFLFSPESREFNSGIILNKKELMSQDHRHSDILKESAPPDSISIYRKA